MEPLFASAVGVLVAAGVYLLLRARTFPVVLGLALLSYAANFFVFGMGRLRVGLAPIVTEDAGAYPDPLPQALVLTAIVIGFGMTAFVLMLALRANFDLGTDHVDGRVTEEDEDDKGNGRASLENEGDERKGRTAAGDEGDDGDGRRELRV